MDKAGDREEKRLRLILDSALDAIISIDAQGGVLDWNKRAEAMFGWSADEAAGRRLSALIIPPRHREAHERGMKRFLGTGEGPILNHRLEITALQRNGKEFPVELTVAPARIDGEWIFSSFIRDLTEKRAADDRLFLQSSAARILAGAQSLDQAVQALLDTLAERTPWDICGFWSLDPATGRLMLAEMRYLPDAPFEAFQRAGETLVLSEGIGLAGKVMKEGKPVWLRDLQGLPEFLRMPQAVESGLRTAFAFPVYIQSILLGVFEFYSREDMPENPGLMDALVSIGSQLGQYLERNRAEDALKRQGEQLNLIMDAAPALISYIGADRRYRFINKAYEEWFGHPHASIVGKTMWDVLGEAAYDRIKPKVDAVLEGETQTFETTLPYFYGGTRYVRGHYIPHRSREGAIEGFIVYIMDLSERRKIEEDLLEKDRFLESIYNGAEEAIFVVEIEEDGRYVFKGFNPAYLRRSQSWGVDMRTLLGKTTRDLRDHFPEELVASVEAKYAECASSDGPIEFEDTMMIDGRPSYWITHLTALKDESGRPHRLIGTSLNITRQKEDAARLRETEEKLRQSQKMDAIGRLAGGIAHDFNNLLTAINGYSELALHAKDLESAREMAEEIKKSGERAAGLTSQLLAFSRKQILLPRVLDLNTIVSGLDSLLQRVIGEHIELAAILAPDLSPIKVDAGQLEQIVLNLALNARDAMPGGGRLTLETYAADLGASPLDTRLEGRPGPQVVLAVSDTGTGMSAEVKEKLFEPFFTTKEPGKGTGMGLATVYGIVNQSGGRIHVYSEPGRGSSFKIYFPSAQGEALSPAKSSRDSGPLARGKGETILLVEDEEVVRTYAQRILEDLGYRVRLAHHGKEAVEMAADSDHPIRLLLTDIVMPGMNGRELWEKLKTVHPDLRVLFMSGYTDSAIVHNGTLDEDAPFLQKPFSPFQLAQKVREMLSGPD